MKRKITSFFSLSTVLLALSSSVQAQSYCSPTSDYGCGHYISNVNLTGETIALSKSSNCSEYTFFSSENKPDLIAGNSYTINVIVNNYNSQKNLQVG